MTKIGHLLPTSKQKRVNFSSQIGLEAIWPRMLEHPAMQTSRRNFGQTVVNSPSARDVDQLHLFEWFLIFKQFFDIISVFSFKQ